MSNNPTCDTIFDAEHWGAHGAPHEAMTMIRNESPVLWYEHDEFDPVWLVTKHKDVEYVGKNTKVFLSSPRTVIHNPKGFVSPLIGLPQLDAPDHSYQRKAIQGWFTPKAIGKLEARINEIAAELIEKMAAKNECEFCNEVSAQLPLKMICELLGIPEEQEATVLQLTRDIFAAADPSLSTTTDSKAGVENAMRFCATLGSLRQQHITDDLASTIANAEVNGAPMTIQQIASHLLIMISAGHDTTASAISGGLLALINNPDQLDTLQQNPDLMEKAINEMLRYVTPTTSFVRTASEDTEIDSAKITKGDDVCIHFSAANRDEDVFEDPQKFLVDRHPNKHLVFGKGPHVCIGLLLAKIEMRALYSQLIPKLKRIELSGEPEYIRSFWVTGLKSLPLLYEFL